MTRSLINVRSKDHRDPLATNLKWLVAYLEEALKAGSFSEETIPEINKELESRGVTMYPVAIDEPGLTVDGGPISYNITFDGWSHESQNSNQ